MAAGTTQLLPGSFDHSMEWGLLLKTVSPGVGSQQPTVALTLRESPGMAGPTPQLLEQLPSIPTSPLVKAACLTQTDSRSDFSEDLSTMVIVHR